uniref:type II secretion system F family protein n=1 Tax=Thaumasiovibrio occultus TaxID=1891184 RepID=UPI000B355ACB|nr:type II secretion system F family protein [Thaumasiovibrio occultus]
MLSSGTSASVPVNTINKIKHFAWRGVSTNGKKVSGTIMGFSESEVREKLSQQNIHIQRVRVTKPSALSKIGNSFTSKDLTAFTRQMATMLQSGVPVVQALHLIAESHKKTEVRSVLIQVCNQVESGTALSKAFSSSSTLFDKFYCDLVSTGEETGHLPEVFARLSLYREKSEELRRKVVKAMIYPTIVVLVATAVTLGMLIFVIPQFAQIFQGFDAELPAFTQMMIDLSEAIRFNGPMIFLSIVAFCVIFSMSMKRSEKFRKKVHQKSLGIPVFGSIFLKTAVARFARTLATTFSAGIPLLQGLESGGQTTTNLYVKEAIFDTKDQTTAGMPLYQALRQTEVFPELMLQMVMIGEESGALDDMLNKCATLYEEDVDNLVDNLGRIIEPFIIVFLGVVVGGLLVAMYLPIFQLGAII